MENAGKRTKCRNCGKALVVPDADWEVVPDDDEVGVEETAPTPRPTQTQAEPARRRLKPANGSEPEPTAYSYAEAMARRLSAVNQTVGFLGVVASLAGAVLAVVQAGNVGLMAGLLGGAVFCLVSVFATDAFCQTILVIVDLARTARAVRAELAEGREM